MRLQLPMLQITFVLDCTLQCGLRPSYVGGLGEPASVGQKKCDVDAPQSRPGDATEAPQDARGQTLWPQLSAMDARNP
ncbi:hypothetical protein AK812_SmicGene26584 [Symbiodinium microadriaticum]|uniref:Uncharacterized protein n=1 Tax=Symbiodinium microadriaticum TaxID=2951 RepID=A0A1Q9D954_SYMMI|nr:hypothetical protein AK812_SmicGene26584 [Symbiodinium microadriaticum]